MTLSIRTARIGAAVVATGAALAVVGIAGPASATGHASNETFVIGGDVHHPVVIAHGKLTAAGQDDPNHENYDVLHFAHGSFRVVHPNKQAKFVAHVDKKTCYASFTESGTFTLKHGTGRFKGISGSGHYSASGTAILPRTKAGACDENSEPKVEIFTVHARGTIN